jgi:hypothetical protein
MNKNAATSSQLNRRNTLESRIRDLEAKSRTNGLSRLQAAQLSNARIALRTTA